VGATLALALERSGLSVALIEAREPRGWHRQEMDLRVFALSHAARNILTRLGAWERIAASRVSPYRAIEVWDAASSGRVCLSAAEVDEPDLGHIVEGSLLTEALLERVRAAPDIGLHAPAALERVSSEPDYAELVLDNGKHLRALLVVGADGARSRVRRFAGIELKESTYGQHAIVAHLVPEKPHGEVARQVFHPNGPLALLPLADGRVSIVWSTTPEEAERLLAVPENEFSLAATEASEAKLGTLRLASERAAFPLIRLHAQSYVAPRVVLAGDAAHVVHPLAGQGMNLGLLDAAALAETIRDGRRNGYDPDDFLVLRRYERWRHGENLAMQSAFSGFKELFGARLAPVRAFRGAGMRLFDNTPPAKRLAMRIALGIAGDLPELAKPID